MSIVISDLFEPLACVDRVGAENSNIRKRDKNSISRSVGGMGAKYVRTESYLHAKMLASLSLIILSSFVPDAVAITTAVVFFEIRIRKRGEAVMGGEDVESR